MSYIDKSDLSGRIPDEWLDAALDDDAAGGVDSGKAAALMADVDDDINGRLSARYAVPVSPVPSVIKAAARAIAAALIYRRRGVADEANPFARQASDWQARLDRIGRGDEPLLYDKAAGSAPAKLISETAKTYATDGALLV